MKKNKELKETIKHWISYLTDPQAFDMDLRKSVALDEIMEAVEKEKEVINLIKK